MRLFLKFFCLIVAAVIVSSCAGGNLSKRDDGGQPQSLKNGNWTITGKPADELIKGILGSEFGEGLNKPALKKALEAEYAALESGQTGAAVNWIGSAIVTGMVIPQQVYEVGQSKCRRYQHTIIQNAIKRSATGTACRDKNGIWKPLT